VLYPSRIMGECTVPPSYPRLKHAAAGTWSPRPLRQASESANDVALTCALVLRELAAGFLMAAKETRSYSWPAPTEPEKQWQQTPSGDGQVMVGELTVLSKELEQASVQPAMPPQSSSPASSSMVRSAALSCSLRVKIFSLSKTL